MLYLKSFILYVTGFGSICFDEGILLQKRMVNQFRPKHLAEVEWADSILEN